jgi:hypothetical protein
MLATSNLSKNNKNIHRTPGQKLGVSFCPQQSNDSQLFHKLRKVAIHEKLSISTQTIKAGNSRFYRTY